MAVRLVTPILALLLVAACSAAGEIPTPSATPVSSAVPVGSPTTGASPSATDGAAEIDRAFIDMMVPHHQSAVVMAEILAAR